LGVDKTLIKKSESFEQKYNQTKKRAINIS